MPNVTRKSIHQALERAAKTISSAAGSDKRVTQSEIQSKLKELTGDERVLVDTFYRFIDHRDAAAGANVSATALKRAVDYAKSRLVDAYDVNTDGLSTAERAKMSKIGQLAATIAEKAVTPKQAAKEAAKVLVTGGWKPDALPAIDRADLSSSARRSFDAMLKQSGRNDMYSPPIARKLTAGGESFTIVAQFTHDSFHLELYSATGRKTASGSGWGTPDAPIEWR